MGLYISKKEGVAVGAVALDDMILTGGLPTTAGSKMLEGYMSPFDAEVVGRLQNAGFEIGGKVNVGEFSIDMLGETSHFGVCTDGNGMLSSASAELLKSGEVKAVVGLDVNGMQRRAAALSGLVYVKPTYGTVSRYGTVPAACSGETVGVMARNIDDCRELLEAVVGHDDKDGTSLPAEKCGLLKKQAVGKAVGRVAVADALADGVDGETAARIDSFRAMLVKNGVEVCGIGGGELLAAKAAWNILLSAELCNNVSRYDGVKYGYRTPNYSNIDELYTNSRTEAFGELLKAAVLFGSDALSADRYMKVYDKALRVRRVISEYFGKLFGEYDALLLPACSKAAYSQAEVRENVYLAFDENRFTAPASITGLPTVVAGGVQLIGRPFSENSLFDIAKNCEKEGGAK